jgi:O-antigen/teichoic acid export membrane protein
VEVGGDLASEPTAILDTQEAGGAAIRGSAVRLVGYGATVLLSIVSVAALTRHLGAADYGRYSVVVSLVSLTAGVVEAGLVNVGIREYAIRKGDDRRAMLANLQGVRIALGLLGVAIAVVYAVAAGYDHVMLVGAVLTGVGIVLAAVQATLGVPLSASLRWGSITGLDVLRQALQLACVLALVAAGAGLLPFFAISIPVGLIVLAATVPLVRGPDSVMPAFNRERWVGLLRLVAPYAAATAVTSVYVFVAAVLMELVAPAREVGWFAASFRVFVVIGGIPVLLVGATFPILARAARDDRQRLRYATERVMTTSFIGGLWMGLMVAMLAGLAISVVAGPKFAPSVAVLRIQALAVVGSFMAVAAGHVLISLGRFRELLVVASTALVVSATITLALAPSLGAKGGGIANVAGEGINAFLSTIFLLRAEPGLRIPWATVVKVLVVTAVAAAPALIPGLPAVIDAVIASLLFGALLLALRLVPDELLDLVPLLRR